MSDRARWCPCKGCAAPSRPLGVWHYLCLQQVDLATDGRLGSALNAHGLPNWTVCPLCCVDDFTHVEGCPLAAHGEELAAPAAGRCLGLGAAMTEHDDGSCIYRLALQKIIDWPKSYEEIMYPEVEAFITAVLRQPPADLDQLVTELVGEHARAEREEQMRRATEWEAERERLFGPRRP